jgi:UDP-2,3-diacylglucosamine hydrolase
MNSMRITAISDVHVKSPHDEADRLLCHFLDHPLVQSSQYVLLMGDIFDLMCGPHEEYLKDYSHLFQKIDSLIKQHKKVLFFEGNHDVHLEKLFKKYWPKGELIPSQIGLIEKIDGKTYYFSHGDEHEIDNIPYQRYKSIIMTPPAKFLADNLMPYAVLNFIGEKASQMSRKKGAKLFDHELIRERFRSGVISKTKGQYDIVLGGHSHVKDYFQSLDPMFTYVNNGFALKEKTFILIEDHHISFEPLS